MAKYLNSTGVSLLWNKIKELILDKIASIVPFVYVSTINNTLLPEKYRNHNKKYWDSYASNYISPYIIFVTNGAININGIGTKLNIADDDISYIDDVGVTYLDYDETTGNINISNNEEIPNSKLLGLVSIYNESSNKPNKYAFAINGYYGNSFNTIQLTDNDIFFTIVLPVDNNYPIDTIDINENFSIAKHYNGDLPNVKDHRIVLCEFKPSRTQARMACIGYLQNYKVYIPDFEKSLFEVYKITETATTRIEDMPFANIDNMWANLSNDGTPDDDVTPFLYAETDKSSANANTTGNQIIFNVENGKEAIYTQAQQYKTLPTGGKAGQILFCKGHGAECGYDNDKFIDAEWQDNFEQTLGNGLVINIPLFAIDEIDTSGSYVLNSSNNFQDDIDGFEEISLNIWSSSFKPSYEYDKYLSRVNILLNNDFGSFDEWLLYEITFKNGTNGTITCETSDKTISFNAGETKELAWNIRELGSMFTHEGTWTLKLKGIKYIYNKFNYIDKINKNLDNDGFIDINLFNTLIYSNLKDAISNITPKSELDETYADKTLVTIMNNRLYDQVPVKVSYADGKIIFESESQKIAFPMANSYTTYDQYVTGFATGDLNIQQGTTIVPVDKNGRFKRVFPYNTTTSMPSFNSCREVTYIDMSRFDTKKITSIRNTFKDCSNLTYLNISGWDISNVTGPTDFIFYGCSKLKHIDVSNWDTGGSTDMNSIFSGCTVLEDIDVSNWDTSNVVDMRNMFRGCYALKELNVSNWNVAKVTNFYYTFSYMNIETLDLSSWQNDVVTNLAGMFKECKITSLNLSGFNTANVTTMADMFTNCINLKELNLSNWNVSKVTTMENMFANCIKLQSINFGNNWNMDKVTKTTTMFAFCHNLTTVTGTISNLKKSLNLMRSPLTNASAMVFINGIAENGSGITLTFKKSTYDTLTAEQKAIATNKGATIDYV